jgi:hypothetical protein
VAGYAESEDDVDVYEVRIAARDLCSWLLSKDGVEQVQQTLKEHTMDEEWIFVAK